MKDWHGFPSRGKGKSVLYKLSSGVCFLEDGSTLGDLKGSDYTLLSVDECGPEFDYAIADAYGARAEYLATIGIIVGEN